MKPASPTAAAKHTSGPWTEERHPTEGPFITGGDEFHSVICQIREYYRDEKAESDANARLIASAPELLDALKAAQQRMRRDNPYHDDKNKRPDECAICKAEAAIEKAEGRP